MWHSLGYVQIPAAGTPVRATANQVDPAARQPCQTILFQQHPDNTGLLYICDRAGANKTTGVGILAVIPLPSTNNAGDPVSLPNGSASIPNAPAPFNAADFYVDAAVNGDKCVISILR